MRRIADAITGLLLLIASFALAWVVARTTREDLP